MYYSIEYLLQKEAILPFRKSFSEQFAKQTKVTFLKDVYDPTIVGIEIFWFSNDVGHVYWVTDDKSVVIRLMRSHQVKFAYSKEYLTASDHFWASFVDYFLIQGNINKYCASLVDFTGDYSAWEVKFIS